MNDEILTLQQIAELTKAPIATVRYWRAMGSGPRTFRLGRRVAHQGLAGCRLLAERAASALGR
jgi:hypothetical protein